MLLTDGLSDVCEVRGELAVRLPLYALRPLFPFGDRTIHLFFCHRSAVSRKPPPLWGGAGSRSRPSLHRVRVAGRPGLGSEWRLRVRST